MKIAISTEEKNGLDSSISHHFGRCPFYVLVDMEGVSITEVNAIDNPYYLQHKPGMVPEFIKEQGVDVMISGGMGRRAIGFFEQFGIQVATGAVGNVRMTLEMYMDGKLQGPTPCRESVNHAGRGHHHD
jgi:predicted Fe-Mo cluster-binding NifX family protein